MNFVDIFIQNYFSTGRTPFITEFMYVVSRFFDVTDVASLSRFVVVIFCITVLIYMVRNIKYGLLFTLTLFCGAVITYFLKIFFDVTRPLDGVVIALGQSFPSYHATIATIFFVMLMYIFDDYFRGIKRTVFNSICVVGILLVSVSRVYLGVHWLSDVMGGIALGFFISYLFVKIFEYFLRKQI